MFLELIRKRRSIRRFREQGVEPEKIDLLIEAALRAPSSRGLNPWEFIVVTDRDLLKKLARAKAHGSSFLVNAPLGIVICADPQRCDVWIEDCSIASIFIHLTAESIGLGSCWVQIRDRVCNDSMTSKDYVKEVLSIPRAMRVESIIALGYPDEKKPPHPGEDLDYKKVFHNSYGKSYGG